MTWRSGEGCLGEKVVRKLGDGARMVLCCAGSAMGLPSMEPSWSDAGRVL